MTEQSIRQQRYVYLRKLGFSPTDHDLPGEAKMLARFEYNNVPYMKRMVDERKKLRDEALKSKFSKEEWFKKLKEWYVKEGWTKESKKTGKLVYDPWAMLRFYREQYMAKNPQYEGVYKRRNKNLAELERKLKKEIYYPKEAKK